MTAVTVPARGRTGSPQGMAHAVYARGIILLLLLMATAAIGRRHLFVMDHFLDAVMTIHAIQGTVDGVGETVRWKHRHGHRFAVDRAAVGRIGMAIQTIGIFQSFSPV